MPTIRFARNYPPLVVADGTNLMEELLRAGIPVASSCHGDGICAKCRVRVLSGRENLSKIEGVEKLVSDRLKIHLPYRLSCQTRVEGDIEIETSYW